MLGHLVIPKQVQMDPKKVQVIINWQAPSSVKNLWPFLGMANYYQKFIVGYSNKKVALTDLLMKDVKWV